MPETTVAPRPARDAIWAVLLQTTALAGYLYLGYPRRYLLAMAFFGAVWAAVIFGLPSVMMNASGLMAMTLVVIMIWLLMIVDVIQIAVRRKRRVGRRYQRLWIYVAVYVAMTAASLAATAFMEGRQDIRGLRAVVTPSSSMVPTLEIGDMYYVAAYEWPEFSVERGDVVILNLPHDPAHIYDKRIIGLPGDTLQWIGGVTHVNGVPLLQTRLEDGSMEEVTPEGRSYRLSAHSGMPYMLDTPIFEVPDGHVFVVGDNRGNSHDSRAPGFGPVPLENVLGKAIVIYWSRDWSRIGMPVR